MIHNRLANTQLQKLRGIKYLLQVCWNDRWKCWAGSEALHLFQNLSQKNDFIYIYNYLYIYKAVSGVATGKEVNL